MPVTDATYYGFTRVREMGPEANDWAVTDWNWELVSKIIKKFEAHTHTGAAELHYPGFNVGDPNNPTLFTLTERTTDGGVLSPGLIIGVRIAYLNEDGLETDSTPEVTKTLGSPVERPVPPVFTSTQQASNAVPGGSYVYVMTKGKGTGESVVSDVLPVDIPYDNTYSVTMSFPAISTYTDGTEKLHIYRSAGLNSQFARVTTITNTATTSFTDTNNIDPANLQIQPPATSTFDAVRSVRVDWSNLTHPSDAKTLRVYVTQEAFLWSTIHWFKDVDLTVQTPDTYATYLGNETLTQGWPKNTSQTTGHPPKVDLSTEATGGIQATAASDFEGNTIRNANFNVLPDITLQNGMFWYDTSANAFKGRINGTTQTLAQAGASYVHSAEDQGGHLAANIRHHTGAATPSAKTVLDYVSDTSTGARKQVQDITVVTGTGNATTDVQSPTQLSEMSISNFHPQFDNQYVEIIFDGQFTCSSAFATLSLELEIDGQPYSSTIRGFTFGSPGASVSGHLYHMMQFDDAITYTIRVLWWTSSATITAVENRRILTVKKVF